MLGNIYEQLVNVEEQEEQAKAGIFYTPKVEIELMFKRSLVEFIYNKTKINKEKLYRFIFDKNISFFSKDEIEEVLKNLNEILILDPACGSGHYLVVGVEILYELKECLRSFLGKKTNRYEEKKKIIEHNIYGNDIKEWVAEIAKLRLWLDLFIDVDEESLKNQWEPLLPQFNFKIRHGDSLVQRFGDGLVPLRNILSAFKYGKESLQELQNKKISVYENKEKEKAAKYWERKAFLDAIRGKIIELQKDIKQKTLEIDLLEHPTSLFDDGIKELPFNRERIKKLNEEKQRLTRELENFQKLQEEIRNQEEMPMIWDLAFAEVFEMKKGFDIIIANPPYVRQEKIEDLNGFYSKNAYKEKLIEQTRKDWSYSYEGKVKNDPNSRFHPIPQKFDKKCDLYIYFYLKGLRLLNPDGVLCYISSNSWLDVGFGRVLQEVLIKRCPIVAIYDNQVKRSFKHADVNTIIALIKTPKEQDFDEEVKNNEVRFVMFKKPFEEIMYSDIFIDLERDYDLKEFQEGKRRENENYRLHIINQKDLWEFGKDEETGQYIGNKWGGKYLRAPEIYWKILEKGKGKLVRLGDIAEVKRGFTTGANEFFYLEPTGEPAPKGLLHVKNSARWEGYIEEEFLKPVIKSPRELKTIIVKEEDLKYKVFMCHKSKEELQGTYALEYIEWGEKQEYHKRPTCAIRPKWWSLGLRIGAPIIVSAKIGERYMVNYNPNFILEDKILYRLTPKFNIDFSLLTALLNWQFVRLNVDITCRQLTGAQAIADIDVTVWENIYIFNNRFLNLMQQKQIFTTFKKLASRNIKSIFEELGFKKCSQRNCTNPEHPYEYVKPEEVSFDKVMPDRRELDRIIFEAIGLTEKEQLEVYRVVVELVKNRLLKAKKV